MHKKLLFIVLVIASLFFLAFLIISRSAVELKMIARQVTAGNYHTLAIKTDGSLWSWGLNNYGQLGFGNTRNSHSPAK